MAKKEKTIGSLNRARGKRTEKALAKHLDGLAIGILGGADIIWRDFAIEVKSRKSCIIYGFWEQAERNCIKGMRPLVIIHKPGQKHDNAFVVMNLKEFKKLIEER